MTPVVDFDIEIGNESVNADVYTIVFAENVRADDLVVKINGSPTKYLTTSGDGLYVFKADQSSVKGGINKFYIEEKSGGKDNQELKDAAIFFCRDKNDVDKKTDCSLYGQSTVNSKSIMLESGASLV